MKIHESQNVLLEQQSKVNKNTNTDAGSFQQIMDQVTSSSDASKSLPVNINPVQIIDGTMNTVPVNGVTHGLKEKDALLDSLKDTMDLVDFYAGKLADKSFPAEHLSSLVNELDTRLESIKTLSSKEGVPEKLKPVISDLAITIGTEIERFRRGDYV